MEQFHLSERFNVSRQSNRRFNLRPGQFGECLTEWLAKQLHFKQEIEMGPFFPTLPSGDLGLSVVFEQGREFLLRDTG